ncbi:MAG TPA: glycogen synthase [Chloroflexota bacterium]|nr:glycogen synthase [Chloroflexota bacterium]
MRILYLSVEVEPFAKTGGLGDVGGALPKALARQGADVRVCLPKYGGIQESLLEPAPLIPELQVPVGDRLEPVVIRQSRSEVAGVPVYLVQSAHYFDRPSLYGHVDDGERFIAYARAALELCRTLGWQPDIVHCHDWHTAIVPNWLQTIYRDDPFFADTATVYTIHNLAYQGIFDFHYLWLAGIAEHGFLYPKIAELAHVVDLMGRGILFADVITTVSEQYAQEILTPEFGERLDPLLRERRDRLFGILNGIDEDVLDPRSDPHLRVNFSVETLDRRALGKRDLQQEAGLPVEPRTPLLGMVGRLSDQKGLDILLGVAEALLRQPLQLVILGTGDPHYQEALRRLAEAHPSKVAAFLTFDTPLAQRIYAGSDIFLMPSRYEPCGLGQMIAMRYGSVPVVRATGGLATTVADWDPHTGTGTGFRFQRYDSMDLFAAVIRATETYKYPEVWRRLQRAGMQSDFSWRRSAGQYMEVYRLARRWKEVRTSTPGLPVGSGAPLDPPEAEQAP